MNWDLITEIVIQAFVFVFGLVFGSFYNVVIYRTPLDISVAKGRSFCPNCKTPLKGIDLVPVFSQLFLGSKCRYCKHKISLRYPAIELVTGGLFLLCYNLFGFSWELLLFIPFWSMLLISTMIDFDHMFIIDNVIIIGTIPTVVYVIQAAISDLSRLWDHLIGLGVGFGIFMLIYITARLIYKQEAFGSGDVMLMSSIGLALGWMGAVITILFSFILAMVGIIIMKTVGKKVTTKTEIPFGPYICLAAFIVSIFGGGTIFDAYMGLFI